MPSSHTLYRHIYQNTLYITNYDPNLYHDLYNVTDTHLQSELTHHPIQHHPVSAQNMDSDKW